MWVLGTEPWFSERAVSALTTEPSLQPSVSLVTFPWNGISSFSFNDIIFQMPPILLSSQLQFPAWSCHVIVISTKLNMTVFEFPLFRNVFFLLAFLFLLLIYSSHFSNLNSESFLSDSFRSFWMNKNNRGIRSILLWNNCVFCYYNVSLLHLLFSFCFIFNIMTQFSLPLI